MVINVHQFSTILLTFVCNILLSIFFSNFHIVGFCPLFMLWDFVHFLCCGILSCGILSCGILSVGILSCGILSCGILSRIRSFHVTAGHLAIYFSYPFVFFVGIVSNILLTAIHCFHCVPLDEHTHFIIAYIVSQESRHWLYFSFQVNVVISNILVSLTHLNIQHYHAFDHSTFILTVL